MRRSTSFGFVGAAISVLCATASGAAGWNDDVRPRVVVHDHVFDHVMLEATGCALAFKIYFDAPPAGYADKRNAVRNHYRFRARMKFRDGKTVDTNLFNNRTSGRRMYRYSSDTSGAGCWANSENKIVKLDVNACRGLRCSPQRF